MREREEFNADAVDKPMKAIDSEVQRLRLFRTLCHLICNHGASKNRHKFENGHCSLLNVHLIYKFTLKSSLTCHLCSLCLWVSFYKASKNMLTEMSVLIITCLWCSIVTSSPTGSLLPVSSPRSILHSHNVAGIPLRLISESSSPGK